MINVKSRAAQGDVFFRRVKTVPSNAVAVEPQDEYVVAHSETGHHHVAAGADSYHMMDGGMVAYLVASGPVTVEHHRSYDTHEALNLLGDENGGEVIWEIRRQREYTPEGWRRVED